MKIPKFQNIQIKYFIVFGGEGGGKIKKSQLTDLK